MNSYYKLKAKQKEILETASSLFYQNGFKETSMRDISAAINIKAASLYAHITNKEEILEWAISHFVDICENVYKKFFYLKGASAEKISFIIDNNIKVVRDNLKYSELIKRYFVLVSLETQTRYHKFLAEYVEMFAKLLSEFMSEKYFAFDPLMSARLFIHNMNYHYKWVPENMTEKQIVRFFKENLFFSVTGNTIKLSE